MPLSYDAGDLPLRIGDVVRVPLGAREQVAYVISEPASSGSERPLRAARPLPGVPRAFDEVGLQLARFMVREYLCTLGEALNAIVLSGSVPRMIDTFVIVADRPDPARYPSIPPRLVALIWKEFPQGFVLEHVLRHPEARRAADRATLLRHVSTLVRKGFLRRERRLVDPRVNEYRIRALFPGSGELTGRKASALLEFVRQQPGVPRADALLAGFSKATIARALRSGVLREEMIRPMQLRDDAQLAQAAFEPTAEQSAAISSLQAAIEAHAFSETLLFGVTGSGKTFVYIEVIKSVLRNGGNAIVLVPEISLTPQTARRFESAFGGRVAVVHSALSDRERYDAWQACARGEVDIVVGARSAVFAPLRNVRIIIVDESHEGSYKQETSPRYHAVTVARERMRIENGVLLLGSATPALESYRAALDGKIGTIRLKERATRLPLPGVRIIDMVKELEAGNRRMFSTALSQALSDRLTLGEKSILFVNRRGSAAFILCRTCGDVPKCTRCSVSLSEHKSEGLLRCHYCDFQRPIPTVCEVCGDGNIRDFGAGSERVAQEVLRLFPQARVVRMDSDATTHVGDHARLLDAFGDEGDVLVGTQMVAEGLDFPTVTLVGVVAADIGLHAPDFGAAEQCFDVLTQVCGRSGRARPGEAIIQTYSPSHPAIVRAAQHDYEGFAQSELAERELLKYPPSCALLYVGVIGRMRARTLAQATAYAQKLREAAVGEVLGPAPYPIARLGGDWRFRIALKGDDLEPLRQSVRREILPLARADQATRLTITVYP